MGVGVGGWGVRVACPFPEIPMSHHSVVYICQCRFSNERNGNITCRYLFLSPCRISLTVMSHDNSKKKPCHHFEFED